MANHDSPKSLQEASDCLRGNRGRSQGQIEQSQETHLRVTIHIENGDGLCALFRLDNFGFEQRVEPFIVLRTVKAMVLEQEE